ncbi:hypothetical protein BCF55_0840 [Hydrogenivirga caldilitoris]|uniref:Cellulose synthase subunit n=1 Tax=Hydrogenivirga caldilitoris TaxID=246264 RepID=A0A497XQN4_9AQUI|nr:hypothetical protein [Hydrogenivirga caldilitoris]RLJ70564.1 hypothetical protein BCF55_0840 [Hydrogenivirga caldilitoris]
MFLITLLLSIGMLYAQPIFDTLGEVKRFPFITYEEVWSGTPAETKEAAIPNVIVTYGNGEDKEIVSAAANIAYYLGQWTDDMGLTPRSVRKGDLPSIAMPLSEALKTDKPLILLGTKNTVVRSLGLTFTRPTLKVVKWKGRQVLVVGGKNSSQVVYAANFLAHRVVGFKAGAYKTFFSFVRLRGLIEQDNYIAALHLIKDPAGLSACGKNMSLAAPQIIKFPPRVKEVVTKRNKIMYVELAKALERKDKERAVKLWKEAMFTCYQCHQGLGIDRLRKFNPNPDIHSKHQRIAAQYGLVKKLNGEYTCTACHSGRTEIRGY